MNRRIETFDLARMVERKSYEPTSQQHSVTDLMLPDDYRVLRVGGRSPKLTVLGDFDRPLRMIRFLAIQDYRGDTAIPPEAGEYVGSDLFFHVFLRREE